MSHHLVKLCVGCDSVADLERWISRQRRRAGDGYEQLHTTRQFPRRLGEAPEDVSLYWVIKRRILCRQRLLAIRPFTDAEGISRCRLVLEPVVRPVRPRPMGAFQGWRYLAVADAPPDMDELGADAAMPEAMRRELAGLGLL